MNYRRKPESHFQPFSRRPLFHTQRYDLGTRKRWVQTMDRQRLQRKPGSILHY